MASVVNVRQARRDGVPFVYVGRAWAGLPDTEWGNPFRPKAGNRIAELVAWVNSARCSPATRGVFQALLKFADLGRRLNRMDAVEAYEEYLGIRLAVEPSLVVRLLELDGNNLGCWCAPSRCHADVLVRTIRRFKGQMA